MHVIQESGTNQFSFFSLKEIKTRGDINNTMRFIPYYYWSFTLLKNMNYSTLYLACFANGEAKMVPMNNFRYPDTRALFIFNRFEPPGS